jgi:hypothetical protein
MGKKKQKAAVKAQSKIIEQCVIYVQQLAAFNAGFSVDHTGDCDFASKGGRLKKASRAMCTLISLSPHTSPGAPALTALELRAKASVLSAMNGLQQHHQPDAVEQAYIRIFAREVSDFLAANHTEPA